MEEPLERFRRRLKVRREAAGLSQVGLARRAGLADAEVRQIESGRIRNPTLRTALGLADVLGVTVDDLARAPEADLRRNEDAAILSAVRALTEEQREELMGLLDEQATANYDASGEWMKAKEDEDDDLG